MKRKEIPFLLELWERYFPHAFGDGVSALG